MAALYYDPQQAVGVAGALRSLRDNPNGAPLLGLAAIGLACFGLFELAQGARRRLGLQTGGHTQCERRGFEAAHRAGKSQSATRSR
jgi:Domain of Unknown Function (DUF1206)